MPGGFSGIANYNRFRIQGGNTGYGYWDTPGAGILPGGSLRVSPSNSGVPRSMPGIDIPSAPDPGIANDPIYGNTLGLPGRDVVAPGGGGAGEFYGGAIPRGRLPYPAPDMNIPTDENVSPTPVTTYYTDPVTGRTISRGGGYPDLSNALPVTPEGYIFPGSDPQNVPGYEMNDVPPGQNYGGYHPPVARATAVPRRGLWGWLTGQPAGNYTYPTPGGFGGLPSTYGGGQSWRDNASRTSGGFAGGGGDLGAFGGGTPGIGGFHGGLALASVGFGYGGGAFPTFSGGMMNNARAAAGPLQP